MHDLDLLTIEEISIKETFLSISKKILVAQVEDKYLYYQVSSDLIIFEECDLNLQNTNILLSIKHEEDMCKSVLVKLFQQKLFIGY